MSERMDTLQDHIEKGREWPALAIIKLELERLSSEIAQLRAEAEAE